MASIRFLPLSQNLLWLAIFFAAGLGPETFAAGPTLQVIPHVAFGGPSGGIHFETVLLARAELRPGAGVVQLLDDEGKPVRAFFNGQGPQESFETTDLREIVITSPEPRVQGAAAFVNTFNLISRDVVIRAQIRMFNGKELVSQVEQQAAQAGFFDFYRSAAVPFDRRSAKDLGLAILNLAQSEARLQMTAFIQDPPTVESAARVLKAGQRLTGLLSELFARSGGFDDKTGKLEIRSDRPILITAIEVAWPRLDITPVFPLAPADEIFVNSDSGNDVTGDGSSEKPFRTLTRALALSNELSRDAFSSFVGLVTIKAIGRFSASRGEVFPLQFTKGPATLEGVGLENVVLEGGGNFEGVNTTIAVKNGFAKFTRFSITNPNPEGFAGFVQGGSLHLEDARILGNTVGIFLADLPGPAGRSADLQLRSSTLFNNRVAVRAMTRTFVIATKTSFFSNGAGLELRDSSFAQLADNTITSNGVGVGIFDLARIDLGGMLSEGRNVLRGNADADLCHQGSATISAKNNIWDKAPPSVSPSCNSGVDIGGPGVEKVALN